MNTKSVTSVEASEPHWIKGDRERLAQMRNAIKAQPETALVRYQGDMRPMLVSEVRQRMNDLAQRIAADVAAFKETGVTPVEADASRLAAVKDRLAVLGCAYVNTHHLPYWENRYGAEFRALEAERSQLEAK